MKTPTVSFIVPCYNAARYLPEFFESIQAQTYRDFEVLIGDDGSSDNSIELIRPFLRDPRFRLLSWNPNRGMHHGVVFLLNLARGQYWCPPGTDDILAPEFLEKRLQQLESRPEAALIHGASQWIDEHGRPCLDNTAQCVLPELSRRLPESMPGSRMLRILLQHNIINWPSTLVRMDITRLVLPFYSPHWVWTMDWELWILLAATSYDFLYDSESLIQYRVHSQSLSGSPHRRIIRQIERKLTPICALRKASIFSQLAKTVWTEQRRGLYYWWLATAVSLQWKGELNSGEMSFAAEAYRGALPHSISLWRELGTHGLPALLQYRAEKASSRNQLFRVSGFSLIDDPLFKAI